MLGQRIVKRVYSAATGGTVGYTRFFYHGAQVAFEGDSAGTMTWQFVWGAGVDHLLAARDSAGNEYYAATDLLGSLRGWYTKSGSWVGGARYEPYGTQAASSGTDLGLPYRWTGREYDPETGFYYLRARYYDPSAGRFVQEDPTGYDGGSNLYAYVEGQVLSATDPSGMTANLDIARHLGEWEAEFSAAERIPGEDEEQARELVTWADDQELSLLLSGLRKTLTAIKERLASLSATISIDIDGTKTTVTLDHGHVVPSAASVFQGLPDGAAGFVGVVANDYDAGIGATIGGGVYLDNRGFGGYVTIGGGIGEDLSVGLTAGYSPNFFGWSGSAEWGDADVSRSISLGTNPVPGYSRTLWSASATDLTGHAALSYTFSWQWQAWSD